MTFVETLILLAWVGWTVLLGRYLDILHRLIATYEAQNYAPEHEHSLYDVTEARQRRVWAWGIYAGGCGLLALLWWWQSV